MFAGKALRCDCGYEVRASDEAACVHEVQRHASEAHGIESGRARTDVVRRAGLVPSSEHKHSRESRGEAMSTPMHWKETP